MRKLHCVLFVAALSWCIAGAPAQAVTNVAWDIDIFKYVEECESLDENYAIEFEVGVWTSERLKKVKIQVPGKGAMNLVNTYRFHEFEVYLEADDLSYNKFQKQFPPGKYKIQLFPKSMGKLVVNVVHEFPDLPVITNLACGETVDLPVTITWNPGSPLPDAHGLEIRCEDGSGGEWDLGPDAVSLTVQPGEIGDGTRCALWLEAENTDGRGNDRSSVREIFFFTAP